MTTREWENALKHKAYSILVKDYGYEYDDYDNPFEHNFWYTYERNSYNYEPKYTFLRENKIIEICSIYNFANYIKRNLKIANCVMQQNIYFEFWIAIDKNSPFVIIDSDYIDLKYELNEEIKQKNIEKYGRLICTIS
jgi:hypothetical protein